MINSNLLQPESQEVQRKDGVLETYTTKEMNSKRRRGSGRNGISEDL